MQIISVSLSPQEVKTVNKLAKELNRSRSQIIKEALALYKFESRWNNLRKTGDIIAKKLGIETDDDVQQVAG